MTVYVAWPIDENDADFRAAYLLAVNEAIQDSPAMNDTMTHYIVGSSRVNQDHIAALQAAFPAVYFGTVRPDWWVDKIDEVQ